MVHFFISLPLYLDESLGTSPSDKIAKDENQN